MKQWRATRKSEEEPLRVPEMLAARWDQQIESSEPIKTFKIITARRQQQARQKAGSGKAKKAEGQLALISLAIPPIA